MPNTKTAKKENRKMERRRLRNKSSVSKMRTLIKSFLNSEKENKENKFIDMQKYMDSLASKGIVKKQYVSRKLSKMHVVLKKEKI